MSKGYLGVDFFFILSGFILTHVYYPLWAEGRLSWRDFLVRRLARIYPLHFLTLLVAAGIGVAGLPGWHAATTWLAFIANLLLVHAWGQVDKFSFNMQSWSVSAEWFAYLLFPVLLSWFSQARRGRGVFYALIVYAGFIVIAHSQAIVLPENALDFRDITEFTACFGILRIMPEFCLGMALYRFSAAHPWRAPPWVPLVLFAGMLAGFFFGVPDFISILVEAAIICAVAGGALRTQKGIFAHPFAVYLGEISYGFYMVHVLVLYSVLWGRHSLGGPLWFWAGLGFVVAVGVAALLHRFYEIPARRALRRLARA